MKYQAVDEGKGGWQVHFVDDGDKSEPVYIGFAPSIEEAEKMIAAAVTARKAPPVVREYDEDGSLIQRASP